MSLGVATSPQNTKQICHLVLMLPILYLSLDSDISPDVMRRLLGFLRHVQT